MTKGYIDTNRLFKEKHGMFYLNNKHLEDVTVSMNDPFKTLAQLKRRNRWKRLRRNLIQATVVSLAIFCMPITLLLMVFVGTTEIFKKY